MGKYIPWNLIIAKLKQTISCAEEKQLSEWLSNKEGQDIFDNLADIWSATRQESSKFEPDVEYYWKKLSSRIDEDRIKSRRKTVSPGRKFVHYAVAACIACIVAFSASYLIKNNTQKKILASQRFENVGGKSKIILPDGSVVWLHQNSILSYNSNFGACKREVQLEGEALFSVKHDARKPFFVKTSNDHATIKVLGTVFNVQAYPRDEIIEATLLKGKIDMKMKDRNGMEKEQLLSPSDKVSFNINTGHSDKQKVNVYDEIAWMNGKLIFRDTPMPEVLRRLSHFYNVDFEVKNDRINSYAFRGEFDNESITKVMDYLKISSQLDYEIIRKGENSNSKMQRNLIILK